MSKKIDWGKELWCILFFGCIGFTIWPLMVYYLGQVLQVNYFVDLPLRVWAEEKVYGPLAYYNVRSLSSLIFLCFPFIASIFLRFLLNIARK
jgi:hypothetical protein